MVTTTSTTPPPPRAGGFRADLRGVTDAQGAADPDGRGSAVLEANPGRNQLCLALVVSGIGPATSAHLHAGTTAGSGPPVASFTQLTAGTPGGCVRVTDELIKQIRKEPGGFYVDVHTTEFPNGAVRGQLTK